MKYVLRFAVTGDYLCNPSIDSGGISYESTDEFSEAFVFANLSAAAEIARGWRDDAVYLVPLVPKDLKRSKK